MFNVNHVRRHRFVRTARYVLLLALVAGLAVGSWPAVAQDSHQHHQHDEHLPPQIDHTITAAPGRDLLWSDPATWGDRLPDRDDEVLIPEGSHVVLDTESVVRSVTIAPDARLVFAPQAVELRLEYMLVSGVLEVGTPDVPYVGSAVIEFTGLDRETDIAGMGGKGLFVFGGGVLDLHGSFDGTAWTRLAATAQPDDTQITLDDVTGWQVGDQIVIAPSGFDYQEAEDAVITALEGNTATLDRPLRYVHFGELLEYADMDFDMRAEVGLLTRNIVLRGDEIARETGFGGQVAGMPGSVMRVHGVEMVHMGQQAQLGRYPIHFHLAGDVTGSYIRKSSIHHAFNRGITVHGTHRWLIQDNIIYDTIGHAFFIEDGVEHENILERNLGLVTRRPQQPLIPSDTQHGPATFWLSNPNNIMRGNVAAGSAGSGIWIDPPERSTGTSAAMGVDVRSQSEPVGEFVGNVAHSNGTFGIFIEPVFPPHDFYVQDATVYKNRSHGMWITSNGRLLGGGMVIVDGARVADNSTGIIIPGFGRVQNTVYVGRSANNSADLYAGRSPGSSIIGHRFYDGPTAVVDSAFVNYETSDEYPAGAFSWRAPLIQGRVVGNTVENVQLVNANAAYVGDHGDMSYGADVSYPSLPFVDIDGSLTGVPHSIVASSFPLMVSAAAVARPEWNAHIVTEPVGLLRKSCASGGCPTTFVRDDGAMAHVGFDGRFNVLMNHSYTMYRRETTCDFEVVLIHEFAGDWVRIATPYTCELDAIAREPNSVNLRLADSVEAVSRDTYYFDAENNMLHFMLYQPGDNNFIENPTSRYAEVRVQGSGSNTVILPPGVDE